MLANVSWASSLPQCGLHTQWLSSGESWFFPLSAVMSTVNSFLAKGRTLCLLPLLSAVFPCMGLIKRDGLGKCDCRQGGCELVVEVWQGLFVQSGPHPRVFTRKASPRIGAEDTFFHEGHTIVSRHVRKSFSVFGMSRKRQGV